MSNATEAMRKTNLKHGHANKGKQTSTYRSWGLMVNRCLNSSTDNYKFYGGRGITVCDRWRSYENFLKDMGERPEGTSLERINNEQGYFPENCRWATKKEQCRNRRTTRYESMDGVSKSVAEWAEIHGKNVKTVYNRLYQGKTIKEALI